jgi:hypothetical protein
MGCGAQSCQTDAGCRYTCPCPCSCPYFEYKNRVPHFVCKQHSEHRNSSDLSFHSIMCDWLRNCSAVMAFTQYGNYSAAMAFTQCVARSDVKAQLHALLNYPTAHNNDVLGKGGGTCPRIPVQRHKDVLGRRVKNPCVSNSADLRIGGLEFGVSVRT